MKIGIFAKSIVFLIALFIGLNLISPPLLASLLGIYMGVAIVAVLVYVGANPVRLEEWLAPLKILVYEDRAKIPRYGCQKLQCPEVRQSRGQPRNSRS